MTIVVTEQPGRRYLAEAKVKRMTLAYSAPDLTEAVDAIAAKIAEVEPGAEVNVTVPLQLLRDVMAVEA